MDERFVKRYQDLSSERGYQFKFFCDHCGQACVTLFEPCQVEMGDGAWFSSRKRRRSAFNYPAFGSSEHHRALQKARNQGKDRFHLCGRCSTWVCADCWNSSVKLCKGCAAVGR